MGQRGEVDRMSRIEEMERELQRLKDKAEMLEGWQTKVRTLDNFTPEEKIKVFDSLHRQGWKHLQESIVDGYFEDDYTYALYEEMMSQLFGSEIWDVINAVLG